MTLMSKYDLNDFSSFNGGWSEDGRNDNQRSRGFWK